MKKFLLLGTIFVATTAFAFGGIFGGGGHKSSHSGGVDAIGVHINGKDKANIDILEPCPDGLERNTDGTCTVCANGNVYLSYMDDPCGTDTPMNQKECEVGSDCLEGTGSETCCVDGKCRAGISPFNEDLYVCPPVDKKSCKSNKDCESGEFCNVMYSTWDDDLPTVGTCTDIGEKDVDYVDAEIDGLGMVRRSNAWLTWFAAENWCKAQGKNLISVEKFGCYLYQDETTSILASEGLGMSGQCCQEGINCDPWNEKWNENNIKPEYEASVIHDYSPILISLYKVFGHNDAPRTASRSQTGSHYSVIIHAPDVSNSVDLDDWGYYALCQ